MYLFLNPLLLLTPLNPQDTKNNPGRDHKEMISLIRYRTQTDELSLNTRMMFRLFLLRWWVYVIFHVVHKLLNLALRPLQEPLQKLHTIFQVTPYRGPFPHTLRNKANRQNNQIISNITTYTVINLSSHKLSEDGIEVLSLGLGFCPEQKLGQV